MVTGFSVPPSWYDGLYSDSCAPCGAARSFSMLHDPAPASAVLLIHGYAGYPGELVSPARELFCAGHDVFVPRLPGMGTCGRDFVSSSARDWQGLVDNASRYLLDRYDRLLVVAHSMGCLLAVLSPFSPEYSRAVLSSPAFSLRTKVPRILLKGMLKAGKDAPVPWKSDPGYKLLYEGAPCDDGYLGREYWSHLYPGPFLELLKLQDDASRAISVYDVPTLVLLGTEDALAGIGDVVLPPCARISYVDGGSHYLYYDKNREAYAKAVSESVRFLSEG